ncbi:MAG: FecCD family ABC transporter permease [Verrucomicrobiota bacterium]
MRLPQAVRILRRPPVMLGLIAVLLLLSMLSSIGLGDKPIALEHVLEALAGAEAQADTVDGIIVRNIRTPRVLTAVLVGAALAVSGAVLQAIFRNPLADPGLIGVSAGGAAGAIVFIVFGAWLIPSDWDWLRSSGLSLFPMAGGIGITFLVYWLSRHEGRTHVTTMLLTGLAINALVGALIGYAVFFSDDDQLRDFTFWSLGSLARANWSILAWLAPVIAALVGALLLYRRQLNLMLLGEYEALHLGVDVEKIRRHLIFLTAGGVGLTVALCGMIGFVGLITPHLCRLLLGPDHRWLLPASALMGAALLVNADLLARVSIRYSELPVGVLTATVGAPFFLMLVARSKRRALF